MSNNALAIYLDAPLQAWGASSKFQRRETEPFPTKSGILGLVAAAMGIDKHAPDEEERLRPLAGLKMSVLRVDKPDGSPIRRLSDFHTIGGGFDRADPREKLHIARTADGKVCRNAVITHRAYLMDARFLVVLEGDETTLASCAEALANPKWGVWFGRKCCIPASPLTPVLAASAEEALGRLAARLGLPAPGKAEGQQEKAADGSWYQADQPLSFGRRVFQSRPVARVLPELE